MFTATTTRRTGKSWLDRSLSIFADVRAGEGATALLMLANIFLLLVCYSVIKTVREPLILLGGGAEVRSYAAAGQALILIGFVPLYSWFANRVDRARLLVGVKIRVSALGWMLQSRATVSISASGGRLSASRTRQAVSATSR